MNKEKRENEKCPECWSELYLKNIENNEGISEELIYDCENPNCNYSKDVNAYFVCKYCGSEKIDDHKLGYICPNSCVETNENEDHDSNVIPFMTPEQEEVQEVIRVQALQNQVLNQEIESQKRIYGTKAELQASYFHDLLEEGFEREEALQLVITTFLEG